MPVLQCQRAPRPAPQTLPHCTTYRPTNVRGRLLLDRGGRLLHSLTSQKRQEFHVHDKQLHRLCHSVEAVIRQELDSLVCVVRLILVIHDCVSFRWFSDLKRNQQLGRLYKLQKQCYTTADRSPAIH